MARPSPGTQRVLAILNFLASSPDRTFSLTDLIIGLRMNRSTCHSLTNELVNAGYLYRTRDKAYVLGPAAAQLGHAALMAATPLQIALPEMSALATRHGVICSAIFHEAGHAVVRNRTASASHLDWASRRDQRWPLRPPFGGIFHAWSEPKLAEAWLDSLEPRPSSAERERTREGMAFARDHGFQFVVRHMPPREGEETMDWIFENLSDRPLQIATSLDDAPTYDLASMSSPVFENHKIAFAIGLSGFARNYTGAEIAELGAELRTACERVTGYSMISNECDGLQMQT